ncbi:MAG: hypothetical protein QOF58_738 [Pseudonocardiales bacterium]|nr:hypothetical protein [Pseudonocardiales bacterium]
MARSARVLASRPRRTALAVSAALLTSVVTGAVAQAAPAAADTSGVTRAGLAPSLVAGRGADVSFLEQEAENALTNGTVIGPNRKAYTLPAEASGRQAVRLAPGQYVEFTLPAATNAINVRYSLPDAPNGGGITAPLSVAVGGKHETSMTLTSQYSWLYNQYQFSNDPNADPIHPDWWMVERDGGEFATGITKPFRPMHFYDEQRLLLSKTYAAGDKLRLTASAGAAWTVIDLVDTELVAKPANKPHNALSVLDFGADPTGKKDAAPAIEAAIASAKAKGKGKTVFIPKGTYQVNRHIVVDNVTIQGAGNWHTIIKGKQVTLAAPLPDKSIHTGVGFYGKYIEAGGSNNVHLSDFAIEGDVRERIDTDQVNGIGGAMSNSTIDGLYIQHTKVGLWFDGPMTNTQVTNNIVVDQIADGINFRRGVTHSSASNNVFRNTGDDAMAMWSEIDADVANVFDHNTVQTPTLANGIAIYGGTDNTVSNNLVADPIREGSGLHAGSRFGARPFTGVLKFTNNTVARAGTYELNWNIGLGAIWIYALESSISGIEVTGDHYLDNTYNAIMVVADWPVKDRYSITNVSFKDVRVDGTGTSVLSARAMGSAAFENVDARNVGAPVPWGDDRELFVNNCGAFNWDWAHGSEFSLVDRGGNDYFGDPTQSTWLPAWLMPNLITCNDRPPVNPPPAPSAW